MENLRKGDFLEDPFTSVTGQIIEIHRREVNFKVGGLSLFQNFQPISVLAGALGQNRPSAPILASPQQRLLWVRRGDRMPIVTETRLRDLVGEPGVQYVSDITACDYFLIVMSAPQFINVSGIAVRCFGRGLSDAAAPPAKLCADARVPVSEPER